MLLCRGSGAGEVRFGDWFGGVIRSEDLRKVEGSWRLAREMANERVDVVYYASCDSEEHFEDLPILCS